MVSTRAQRNKTCVVVAKCIAHGPIIGPDLEVGGEHWSGHKERLNFGPERACTVNRPVATAVSVKGRERPARSEHGFKPRLRCERIPGLELTRDGVKRLCKRLIHTLGFKHVRC